MWPATLATSLCLIKVVEIQYRTGEYDNIEIRDRFIPIKKSPPKIRIGRAHGPQHRICTSKLLDDRDNSHTDAADHQGPQQSNRTTTATHTNPQSPNQSKRGSKTGKYPKGIHRVIAGFHPGWQPSDRVDLFDPPALIAVHLRPRRIQTLD